MLLLRDDVFLLCLEPVLVPRDLSLLIDNGATYALDRVVYSTSFTMMGNSEFLAWKMLLLVQASMFVSSKRRPKVLRASCYDGSSGERYPSEWCVVRSKPASMRVESCF